MISTILIKYNVAEDLCGLKYDTKQPMPLAFWWKMIKPPSCEAKVMEASIPFLSVYCFLWDLVYNKIYLLTATFGKQYVFWTLQTANVWLSSSSPRNILFPVAEIHFFRWGGKVS
jgi:hypothetical protein